MVALLVAALCIGQFRCDQATKAYLAYDPTPQKIVNQKLDQLKGKAIEYVGEDTVVALGTLAAIANTVSKKTYSIRVTKNWSIGRMEVQNYNTTQYAYDVSFSYSF